MRQRGGSGVRERGGAPQGMNREREKEGVSAGRTGLGEAVKQALHTVKRRERESDC